MKIFGGGGSRNKKSSVNSQKPAKKMDNSHYTAARSNYGAKQQQGAAKQQPNSLKAAKAPKRKKKHSVLFKIFIGLLIVLLMLVGAGAIWMYFNVKAPSLADHKNDTTIIDPENGDDPTVNLNVGERIDDFFTFVVCATDIDGTRTDNIMVVAFDTKNHTVNVINIPRDTMSNISKTGANRKINAAYGSGGIEQTKKQIKQLLGFSPDKYIVVSFNGIAEIVDAIGGVEYDIPFPMMYSDPAQDLEINFPVAGPRTLNGEEVVEFLRWRKNGSGYTQYVPSEYLNGDETRIQKQQEFLKELAKQVLTPLNAFKFKDIANAVFNNVKTDLTAGEMIWLAGQAFQIDTTSGIQMFTLPGYSAMSTAGSSTALSFYFPYESQTLELVNQYFNPYDKPITNLDIVSGPTKPISSSSDDDDDDDDEPEETEKPEETENNDDTGENTGSNQTGDNEDKDQSGENNGSSEGGSSGDESGSGENNNTGSNPDDSQDSNGNGDNNQSSGGSSSSGSSGSSSGEQSSNNNENSSSSGSESPSTDPEG